MEQDENKQKNNCNKFLDEFIPNTKTFCVLPWMHLATNTQGQYKLCCKAQLPIPSKIVDTMKIKGKEGLMGDYMSKFPKTHTEQFSAKKQVYMVERATESSIVDIWNNTYMKDVRKKMLTGEKIDSCIECYKEEEQQKTTSYRERKNIIEIIDEDRVELIKQRILNTSPDGSLQDLPYILDLKLDTRCNLACAMCSPKESSGVEKFFRTQIKKQNAHKFYKNQIFQFNEVDAYNQEEKEWSDQPSFINGIEKLGPHLKQIYATGGEPFLLNNLWKIYNNFIKKKYSKNISLEFCSNLTATTDEQLAIIKEFKTCTISASIDGFGEAYNFTRWPSTWEKIDSKVKELSYNWVTPTHKLHYTCVYTILNILSIPQFCNWIKFYADILIDKWGTEYPNAYALPQARLFQCNRPDFLNIEYLHQEAIDYLIGFLEDNFSNDLSVIEHLKINNEYKDIITMLKNVERRKTWEWKKTFWNFIEMRQDYISLKIEDSIPKEFFKMIQ
jgi:anti-sigma28 factor (negative regulator of flagellin synthesis)